MTGNGADPPLMKARVGLWALAGILSLFFAGGAAGKLVGSQEMVEAFHAWGYPEWFMYMVGAVEILGAMLLLFPRKNMLGAPFRFWGALGLAVIMVGAVGTHIVHAEYLSALLPVGLMALLAGMATSAKPDRIAEV